jgi:hypothetical protein
VRGFGLYLEDGTLFAVYGQTDPILEKAAAATFYLAIDWQLAARRCRRDHLWRYRLCQSARHRDGARGGRTGEPCRSAGRGRGRQDHHARHDGESLAGYVNAAQLGAPGGVAMLGADGKLASTSARRST